MIMRWPIHISKSTTGLHRGAHGALRPKEHRMTNAVVGLHFSINHRIASGAHGALRPKEHRMIMRWPIHISKSTTGLHPVLMAH